MEQKTIAKVPIKTDHVELIQKTPDQAFCESRTKEVDLKSLNQAIQELDLGMDFLQKVDAAYEKVEFLLYQIKQLAAPGLVSDLDPSKRSELKTKISFKNEIVAGVIDCPALQERWRSYTVGKTYLNGKETVCRAVKDLEDSVMATTSSHEFGLDKWRAYQSLEQSVNVTTTGSDCYNYGLLVSGYIDLVAEKLTAPYDYLPLVKIVEGAGGVITDWGGNKLPLNGENIYVLAAASPELHKQALGKLQH